LIGAAPVVFLSHLLEHTGVFQLMGTRLQDILVGYPTAVALLVVGVVLLGQSDEAPKRPPC
jgi:di/tricarboxylate transporter